MLDAQHDEGPPEVKARQLREFSLAWLVFFCALGAWQGLGDRDITSLLVLCAVGFSVGLAGLARPSLVRPLFVFAMVLALPIGWVMTRVVLGLLFFGLFTPIGWLFRQLKRDPLSLRKPEAASYWLPASPSPDSQSYFRQSL